MRELHSEEVSQVSGGFIGALGGIGILNIQSIIENEVFDIGETTSSVGFVSSMGSSNLFVSGLISGRFLVNRLKNRR